MTIPSAGELRARLDALKQRAAHHAPAGTDRATELRKIRQQLATVRAALERLQKGDGWKKQPRVPAGSPKGGQFSSTGAGGGVSIADLAPEDLAHPALGSGKFKASALAKGTDPKNWYTDSPKNAGAHNAKIDSLHATYQDGDVALLKDFADTKAGTGNTYTKQQAAYAAILVAHTNAGAKKQAAAAAEQGDLDLAAMKQVGPKPGGSMPGAVYEDAQGQRWLVKAAQSIDHVDNEVLAAQLYKAVGADVPEVRRIQLHGVHGSDVGIASRWLDEEVSPISPASLPQKFAAERDFAADAWLANWDAVGLSFDNTVIGQTTGTAYRIDTGGALLYRAQGAPKGAAFGKKVTELETLKDPSKNPTAAALYGKIPDDALAASIQRVTKLDDDSIRALVDQFGPGNENFKTALADKLIARKQHLAEHAALLQAQKQGAPLKLDTPAPKPVTPKAVPENLFDADWLPGKTGNEVSHNNKLAQIKAAAAAGDAEALLSLKMGTNTYAKKNVAQANKALVAMGYDPVITPGWNGKNDPVPLADKLGSVLGTSPAKAAAAAAMVDQAQATKAQFDPAKLPPKPDFANWKGPGVGLSGKPQLNADNDAAAAELYGLAQGGSLDAVKAYPTAGKSKHIEAFKQELLVAIDEQLNPPLPTKVFGIGDNSKTFPAKSAGKAVAAHPADQKAGDYLMLGNIGSVPVVQGKIKDQLPPSFLATAKAKWQAVSPEAYQSAALYVSSSGAAKINSALRRGKITPAVKAHVDNIKSTAIEVPEGTRLYRRMSKSGGAGQAPDPVKFDAMMTKLQAAKPGDIIQEPGFSSTSSGSAVFHGELEWRLITGPGVRASHLHSGPGLGGEREMLLLPNARYVVQSIGKESSKLVIDAIIMPSDE